MVMDLISNYNLLIYNNNMNGQEHLNDLLDMEAAAELHLIRCSRARARFQLSLVPKKSTKPKTDLADKFLVKMYKTIRRGGKLKRA